MDDAESRRARAQARAGWPMRRIALSDEGREPLDTRSPGELVASVWAITLDAWASAGLPLPTYRRDEMPGRVIRRRG